MHRWVAVALRYLPENCVRSETEEAMYKLVGEWFDINVHLWTDSKLRLSFLPLNELHMYCCMHRIEYMVARSVSDFHRSRGSQCTKYTTYFESSFTCSSGSSSGRPGSIPWLLLVVCDRVDTARALDDWWRLEVFLERDGKGYTHGALC